MYQCKKEKMDCVIAHKQKGELIPLVANGQCARLAQEWCGAPGPANLLWKQGEKVRGNLGLRTGAAIATFINGKYPSQAHGNHAAIYLSQSAAGILVIDQWAGPGGTARGVATRIIQFKKGRGSPSDDGDQYYVIE